VVERVLFIGTTSLSPPYFTLSAIHGMAEHPDQMMLYIICTPRIKEREMRTGHLTEDAVSQRAGDLKMEAGPAIERTVSDPLPVSKPQPESALQRLCLCHDDACYVCYGVLPVWVRDVCSRASRKANRRICAAEDLSHSVCVLRTSQRMIGSHLSHAQLRGVSFELNPKP